MTPIAYLTYNPDGDPAMLFFDKEEAADYCDDGETPEPLVKAADVRVVLQSILHEMHYGTNLRAVKLLNERIKELS